jgi:predicted Zn-dependent protease
MLEGSRGYGSRPPEFLLTHPLTENRIADTKNRAATYPRRVYQDNPEFQLMRARVELSFYDDSAEAVEQFRIRRDRRGKNAVAAQYGLILALTEDGQFAEARELLKPMREFRPESIPYLVAEADIHIASGEYEQAITMLQKQLAMTPGNHPMTMALAEAYEKDGYYEKTDKLLSKHVRNYPSDAAIWYQLAEVQGKSGNILGLHQSRAEYFALNGAMPQAIDQLRRALPLAKNQVLVERIHTRMEYFQNIDRALRGLE